MTVRASRAQEQSLELECNGERGVNISVTVVRGRMLDCYVRGAGALRVLGWTFAGGGHALPTSDAGPYTETRWAGEMVISGTVTVRALLGTDTMSAAAQVAVEARAWVDRIAEPRIVYVSCPFPLTAECPLPEIPEYWNDLGRTDFGPSSWPGAFLTINSGPNTGFNFLAGEESFLNMREPWIVLNDILRHPEHPFWASRKQCDVERLHQESLRHERRHYDGVRQAIEEGGFTPGWLESWVSFGTAEEAAEALRPILQDFQSALNAAGDLDHSNPGFLTEWHCDPGLEYARNPAARGRDRVDFAP